MAIIIVIVCSFLIGWGAGTMRRDHQMWELWRNAERRGSYWFDKYQRAISDDWEPLSEDWTEHDNY